jgi:hypothetical protein
MGACLIGQPKLEISLKESQTLGVLFIFNIFLFVFTLYCFYLIGPSTFPDYPGYVKLATFPEGSGSEHVTEYLSRFILESKFFGFSPEKRVNFFIFFVQAFITIIFLYEALKNPKMLYSATIANSFYLPFFFTTGVRAASLYYIFFLFCARKSNNKVVGITDVLVISLLGSLFHDSFLIVTFGLLLSIFFNYLNLSKKLMAIILILSLPLVLIDDLSVVKTIIELISYDLGKFTAYMELNAYGLNKAIYLCLILLMCSYSIFVRDYSFSTNIVFSFALLIIFSSFINYVVSIRISIFTLSSLFAFSSALSFKFENSFQNFAIFTLPICIALYCFQFFSLIFQ